MSADDDFEEKYENHGEDDDGGEDAYEEIGKMVGWGTVIAMGAAGILFPIRKSAKWIITNYPKSKNIFIKFSKFFRKYHLLIGIIVLALSLFHGVAMYLSEGEIGKGRDYWNRGIYFHDDRSHFWNGLIKNKKVKSLRTTHTILIGFALIIAFVHIITS